MVQCRICGHRHAAVAPTCADLDNLECPNCGNMTCQEYEPPEWEETDD